MNFPAFVYKSPGLYQAKGGTYSYVLIKSEEDLPEIARDYYPTVELAVENQKNPEPYNWLEYLGIEEEPKEPEPEKKRRGRPPKVAENELD